MVCTHIFFFSPAQPHFNCTKLHSGHPCLLLSDRGSDFTLPQTLPVDAVIEEDDVFTTFKLLSSLRGLHPDSCLDFFERYLCILVAPPCDSRSNGLPMLFCEQDCVAYKTVKEENTCKNALHLIRNIAGGSYRKS